MSTSIPAEVIAEALAKHRWRGNVMGCGCGWNWAEPLTHMCGEDERIERAHVAHVASVVAALPDIAIVPRGKRWYTAAYRAGNGNVIPVGVDYVKSVWAEEVRDEWQRDEPEGKYFVACRDVPEWQEMSNLAAGGES